MQHFKTINELIPFLNDHKESVIFLPTWNGYSNTYCVADHAIACDYEEIENDFYGTEGKMDKRLFSNDLLDKKVVFIGSRFDWRIKNEDIDFLTDDPNQPIELINGEDGDHDLFWKSNGFERVTKISGLVYWSLTLDDAWVAYYPNTKTLRVEKGKETDKEYVFSGKCVGLYDFFDIMKACKIEKQWRIG